MIKFFLPIFLLSPLSVSATPEVFTQLHWEAQEVVERYCSKQVGIPYSSSNFSDSQWDDFQYCREQFTEYVYN
jgi:hypothetical protein